MMRITQDMRDNEDPSWSPEQLHRVLLNAYGSSEIWMSTVDGHHQVPRLTKASTSTPAGLGQGGGTGNIDIGSNSVVFLVLDDGGGIVYDGAEVVSLGKGLALSHAFLPDRMDATLQTIASYAEVAGQHGVKPSDIRAITKSASRRAGNADLLRTRPERDRRIRAYHQRHRGSRARMAGSLYGLTMPDAPLRWWTSAVEVQKSWWSSWSPAPESRVIEIGTVRLMEQFFDPQRPTTSFLSLKRCPPTLPPSSAMSTGGMALRAWSPWPVLQPRWRR